MNDYLHDDPRQEEAWAPWFSHEYIFDVGKMLGMMLSGIRLFMTRGRG